MTARQVEPTTSDRPGQPPPLGETEAQGRPAFPHPLLAPRPEALYASLTEHPYGGAAGLVERLDGPQQPDKACQLPCPRAQAMVAFLRPVNGQHT